MTRAMIAVSVVTSVYNGKSEHVSAAIESILRQDIADMEYVIVDDGSSKEIALLLEQYRDNDARIKLISNPVNIGLTKSLNLAVKQSVGKYIARMDADDICYPGRLKAQLDYMENHQEIVMAGGRFDELLEGTTIPQRVPFVSGHQNIKKSLIQFNPFCHSTVMFRKDAFIKMGGYDESFRYAQDYDLWLRLVARHPIQNLDIPFVLRRMDDGISVKREQSQRRFALLARWRSIRRGEYRLAGYLAYSRALLAYLAGKQGQAFYRYLFKRNAASG